LFRDPSREALPDGNLQRGKQTEILAIDVFRDQEIVSHNVDRDGIVRNQALEPDSRYRESFLQAERTSQLASQLEQQANFLAGRGDGIEEVAGLALVRMRDLESGGGSHAAADFEISRKLRLTQRLRLRHTFELAIATLEHLHPAR